MKRLCAWAIPFTFPYKFHSKWRALCWSSFPSLVLVNCFLTERVSFWSLFLLLFLMNCFLDQGALYSGIPFVFPFKSFSKRERGSVLPLICLTFPFQVPFSTKGLRTGAYSLYDSFWIDFKMKSFVLELICFTFPFKEALIKKGSVLQLVRFTFPLSCFLNDGSLY